MTTFILVLAITNVIVLFMNIKHILNIQHYKKILEAYNELMVKHNDLKNELNELNNKFKNTINEMKEDN